MHCVCVAVGCAHEDTMWSSDVLGLSAKIVQVRPGSNITPLSHVPDEISFTIGQTMLYCMYLRIYTV